MSNTFQKFINKDEINTLPLMEYEGEINVIDNPVAAREAVAILSQEKVLGFDTETRPSFTKGESYHVSLLQLATPERAFLFRLSRMPFPPELMELLSNPSITKVGVAILDDLRGLQKLAPFKPEGFLDLAKEAERKGFTSFGLRALTAIFLGKRLSKSAKVTNWDRVHLTPAQLKYAASDALVGLMIYEKLKEL